MDVVEAAGDFSLHTGRLEYRRLGRCLHFVMEAFEPVPGDGGLEGVVDKPRRRQKLARIRHADECISPDARCAFEMRVAGLCRLRHPAMVSPPFHPACHPSTPSITPRLTTAPP